MSVPMYRTNFKCSNIDSVSLLCYYNSFDILHAHHLTWQRRSAERGRWGKKINHGADFCCATQGQMQWWQRAEASRELSCPYFVFFYDLWQQTLGTLWENKICHQWQKPKWRISFIEQQSLLAQSGIFLLPLAGKCLRVALCIGGLAGVVFVIVLVAGMPCRSLALFTRALPLRQNVSQGLQESPSAQSGLLFASTHPLTLAN